MRSMNPVGCVLRICAVVLGLANAAAAEEIVDRDLEFKVEFPEGGAWSRAEKNATQKRPMVQWRARNPESKQSVSIVIQAVGKDGTLALADFVSFWEPGVRADQAKKLLGEYIELGGQRCYHLALERETRLGLLYTHLVLTLHHGRSVTLMILSPEKEPWGGKAGAEFVAKFQLLGLEGGGAKTK